MSKHNDKLTFLEANDLLQYNPDTGQMFWKVPKKGRLMDKEAGCVDKTRGYRNIVFNGTKFKAHRIAWLLTHGEFPSDEIDHINGVKDDNKISNLRSVTHRENRKNSSMDSRNKSGHMGVYFHKSHMKWCASITNDDGVLEHLGQYTELSGAISARKSAEIKYNYHSGHGKPVTNKGFSNV